MMRLSLAKKEAGPLRVLCLGAHSDDIEIGCGGALLQLQRKYGSMHLDWIVLSAGGVRGKEAQQAADLFTAGNSKNVVLKEFRDGFLPYNGTAVKDFFEELKTKVSPDVIFTHWQGDAHQDHRLVCELTWNTFRNHFILEYEIPKYDGDLGRPNVYVPVDQDLCEKKVGFLSEAFESQRAKAWFSRETFLGLMRLRGMESNSASGYSEAFYSRKVVL